MSGQQLHQRPVAANADRQLRSHPLSNMHTGAPGSMHAEAVAQQHQEQQLRHDAGTSKLLVPSMVAFWALIVVPLLLWTAAVVAGIWLHTGRKSSSDDIFHPLLLFDRLVFRTAGPLLPLVPYTLRIGSVLAAQLLLGVAKAPSTPPGGSRPTSGGGGARGANSAASAGLLAGATLPIAGLLYLAVAGVRIALYVGHVALQHRRGLFLVSDHLLLAASVLACLQCELVLCVSDVFKLELRMQQLPASATSLSSAAAAGPRGRAAGGKLAGLVLASAQAVVVVALVASMLLYFLVGADMHFTARYYHDVPETWATLLMGLMVFQVPAVAWLRARATHVPV